MSESRFVVSADIETRESLAITTRTHVDAWHQCIMPGPIILICSNIKIMKYNYFFIEIGIYRSRFDTQYIYPAKIFFYLANIIIDQAFNVWALVQETTGSIPCASHLRDFEVSSLRLEFRYLFHFYKNDTNLVIINYFPL